MSYKAAFIDLDGTLLDSEAVYQRFWKEGIKKAGYDPSLIDTLELRSLDHDLADGLFKQTYGPDVDSDLIRSFRSALMDEYLLEHPFHVKEGVKEGLAFLNQKGISCYIASATPRQKVRELLSSFGLDGYFKEVFSTRDVKRGKPFPDVYLKGLSLAGVSPKEALAIEDAPAGAKAAITAGIDTFFCLDLSGPSKEIIDGLKGVLVRFDDIKLFL